MPWGGMGYTPQPAPDEDPGFTLDDFLASVPNPEPTPAPTQPSRGDLILQLLGNAAQDIPAPQGFGQGLLSGVLRGVGGEGLRRQAERQRIDAAAARRAEARNQANLEASRAFRQARV